MPGYRNIIMDANSGTVVIFFFLIFGVLESVAVIIPAMIRRSKAGTGYQPVYETPRALSQPVSAEHVVRMRSWYFDGKEKNLPISMIAFNPVLPVTSGYQRDSPFVSGRLQNLPPESKKNWKAIDKANWAIQRANQAVREANYAILEANTAIHETGSEDLEWMDDIAEMDKLQFP
jgi:hypothetical protein